MSALRETVLLQMRLRGFAANTVDAYIHAMVELWKFFKRPLEKLSCEDVQRLLEELWRAYRPAEFFFTGRDGVRPISDATAQQVYYTALRQSGVRRVGLASPRGKVNASSNSIDAAHVSGSPFSPWHRGSVQPRFSPHAANSAFDPLPPVSYPPRTRVRTLSVARKRKAA